MSLVVTSLLVAGGVLIGRWMMKSPPKAPDAGVGKTTDDTNRRGGISDEMTTKRPATNSLAAFSVQLGDVVMRTAGEEAWLAGALVFSEDIPTAALFIAPDAGGDRALFVRPMPSTTIVWLEPIASDELTVGSEPPTSLELGGARFERARRLPVRVERIGTGAPDLGERAIVAEYEAAGGERLLVVVGAHARAWRGTALDPGMYDVLPSGKSTLDS